jgi:hypothetical protein
MLVDYIIVMSWRYGREKNAELHEALMLDQIEECNWGWTMKKVFEPESSKSMNHYEIMTWRNAMVHKFLRRLVNSHYVWMNILLLN